MCEACEEEIARLRAENKRLKITDGERDALLSLCEHREKHQYPVIWAVEIMRLLHRHTPGSPSLDDPAPLAAGVTYAKDDAERRTANMSGEWIPVTERTPNEGVDVLVASPCPNSDTPNIDIASWGSEGQQGPVWREADCGRIYPTHWMPLPEPPNDATFDSSTSTRKGRE